MLCMKSKKVSRNVSGNIEFCTGLMYPTPPPPNHIPNLIIEAWKFTFPGSV